MVFSWHFRGISHFILMKSRKYHENAMKMQWQSNEQSHENVIKKTHGIFMAFGIEYTFPVAVLAMYSATWACSSRKETSRTS